MRTQVTPALPELAPVDLTAALAELTRAREQIHNDPATAQAYYRGVALAPFAELATRSDVRTAHHTPARQLHPLVDLQPIGTIRSRYTGQGWEPEELIRADPAIAEARLEALTARLDVAEAPDAAAVATELEAPLPLDCAPMFPDS